MEQKLDAHVFNRLYQEVNSTFFTIAYFDEDEMYDVCFGLKQLEKDARLSSSTIAGSSSENDSESVVLMTIRTNGASQRD